MIINSSTVSMDSGRVYTKSQTATYATMREQISTGAQMYSQNTFSLTYAEYSGSAMYNKKGQFDTGKNESADFNPKATDLYSNVANNSVTIEQARNSLEKFHEELLRRLEELMERIKQQLLGLGKYEGSQNRILDLTTTTGQPGSLWKRQDTYSVEFSESETTTFQSSGTVLTADGRSIDFGIQLEMSRTFTEATENITEGTEYILTDPLVIQLEDAPDTVSNQTWLFDLDGDGTKEEISQLAKGSGFLALDANENGIIDDGSELFGTKSGDGFKDLAKYDEDGNGWIDEKDSVYQKLKVWTKDENGVDHLMDLKAADIGAIHLGAAATQFSHNDLATNETQAVVRQTGFYLHETTGAAGFLQQIDFATKKANNVA